jgi:formate/nitrite transporter
MSYIKPDQVVEQMIQAGINKANLSIKDMLLRGFLGGSLLAFATTLALTAIAQTKLGLVGALVFPVGFVIIILLGLELVTGSFGLIPLAVLEKKTTVLKMLTNFFWVIIGHLIGCMVYGLLFYVAATNFGHVHDNPVALLIIKAAETKTNGYSSLGMDGMISVFVKAILCNWMVVLGTVMAMTSKSTTGKIVAMWLPIFTFYAQGFEHAVVNMFLIPMGILFGAQVTIADWWIWNQIPVLLGNLVGGLTFTGLFLYYTNRKKEPAISNNTNESNIAA